MASQPQSYGSIREFLDNLPNQPCIWQPENANICVTCLRINEPVARVCSVWAQALEDAPLEEIDFEEEVRSLPSVVEIEDEFEMVDSVTPALGGTITVAEVDIVESSSDWDIIAEPVAVGATEEVAEAAIAEPVAVEATEEVAEAAIAEPVAVEATEEVAEAAIAEPVAVEATEEVAEAAIAEPVAVGATEEMALDTIQDAVDAEAIAQEKVESASEADEITAEAVVEAVNTETKAIEAYADAVKGEVQAAETVVEAVDAENVAAEAVIEAAEQVTELIEKEADESDIQEAVTELENSVEKQEEAEEILTEAVTVEETAANEVKTTSTIEEEAAEELEKAIVAEEKASDNLKEAVTQEEKAEEEVKETIEASKELITDDELGSENHEPFIEGDCVTHGVYGNGTVLQTTKAGKHWSIEVDFEKGKRRILGTFLTLNEDKSVKSEPAEESFKRPESEKESEEIDHGAYNPGTKVTHKIFGKGEVKDSKPKGSDYRLEIEFEDNSVRNLLSTFIDIFDETVVAVEATEEMADAIVAQPVIAEAAVLDTDVVYRRPKKKEKEAILDLSKPEVQDAEMVDEED
jgi:hypothetical protein